MANVKYGSLVTDIKGKIGGHVFQGGQFGSIIRSNYKGSNRKNYISNAENIVYTYLANMWQNLTNTQQEAWNAGAYLFPVTDKFGEQQILSGYGVFIMLNSGIYGGAGTLLEDIPTPNGTPETYAIVSSIDVNTQEFKISWTPTLTDSGNEILFKFRWPRWKKKKTGKDEGINGGIRAGESLADEKNIWSDYDVQMHGPLKATDVGKFIWLEYQVVDILTGERGPTAGQWVTVETS